MFAQTNNSLAGYPFSVLSPDQNDSADSDNANEAAESVLVISGLHNTNFQSWNKGMLACGYTVYPVYTVNIP